MKLVDIHAHLDHPAFANDNKKEITPDDIYKTGLIAYEKKDLTTALMLWLNDESATLRAGAMLARAIGEPQLSAPQARATAHTPVDAMNFSLERVRRGERVPS